MNKTNLDEKKIKMMMWRILSLEHKNATTKAKTKEEMATQIKKFIEEEVAKCY